VIGWTLYIGAFSKPLQNKFDLDRSKKMLYIIYEKKEKK